MMQKKSNLQGGRTRLPKFNIGLHVILELQIKKKNQNLLADAQNYSKIRRGAALHPCHRVLPH